MPVTIYRQGADPYEHVLGDLRKRREELDIAIRAIEAVRAPVVMPLNTDTAEPAEAIGAPSGGEFSGISIAEASKKVLEAHGGAMSTADIVPIIQAGGVRLASFDPINTVNSILGRRYNSVGDIVRVGRARWDLKERADRRLSLIGEIDKLAATLETPEDLEHLDRLKKENDAL